MEKVNNIKKDRKKYKKKFTESVKNLEGFMERNTSDLVTLEAFYKKTTDLYLVLGEIHERLVDGLLEVDVDIDTTEEESYMDAVRQTYLDKVSRVQAYKEEKQVVDDESGVEASVKQETDKVLWQLSKRLEEQRLDSAKMITDLGAAHSDALKSITDQLAERLEVKASPSPKLKLQGLEVPSWDEDQRQFFSWKRMISNIMVEAGEMSEHLKIARIIEAVPLEWQNKLAICTTEEDIWREFSFVITKEKVQELVYVDFKKLKPIFEQSPESIRRFVAGVRLYIARMVDLEKELETKTDTCLSDVRYKMGAELNLNYSNFMFLKEEKPSLETLLDYLEGKRP